MPIKTYNPTTPSFRKLAICYQEGLEKNDDKIPNRLIKGITKTSGRNNYGRVTNRNRGGAVKRKYLEVDFKRNKTRDVAGSIEAFIYDPNRTSNLVLIKKLNGHKYLIPYFVGAKIGQVIEESATADIKPGNNLMLKDIPVGTNIHNIEILPGSGGKIARAAGAMCQILGREGKHILVRLPSSEIRRFEERCFATIGQVGNEDRENISIGSAGRHRKMGRRPHVRGVAMNPVDHPLGGGEGKSSGGRHPCSPWGQLAKGLKTRHNKRTDKFIVSRRKRNV